MMKHNMFIVSIWEELPLLTAPTSDRNQQEITGTWVMGICLASVHTVLFMGPVLALLRLSLEIQSNSHAFDGKSLGSHAGETPR